MDRTKLLQNPLPIDRVASRVVFGKAEHWNPGHLQEPVYEAPPQVVDLESANTEANPTFVNLSLSKVGRLLVLGLHAEDNPRRNRNAGGARWVCKCECGLYVLRSSKALTTRQHEDDHALHCGRCERKRLLAREGRGAHALALRRGDPHAMERDAAWKWFDELLALHHAGASVAELALAHATTEARIRKALRRAQRRTNP